jgi:hypothetical protein
VEGSYCLVFGKFPSKKSTLHTLHTLHYNKKKYNPYQRKESKKREGMLDAINAALDRLEEHQREEQQRQRAVYRIPESAHDYLREVYQDPRLPTHVRMKAAIEALPFESPKLSATAVLTSEDFADRLERAIARSGVKLPRTIDAKAFTLSQPE